jgi:hypothetical protein
LGSGIPDQQREEAPDSNKEKSQDMRKSEKEKEHG